MASLFTIYQKLFFIIALSLLKVVKYRFEKEDSQRSNIIPPFTLWYFFFSSLTNNQGNSTTMIILLSISAISTIAMIFTIIYPKIILLDGCLFTGVSLFLLISFPLFLTNEQSSPVGIIGFILSLGLPGFDIYLFLKYKKKKEA